jgi:hypothetical protein
VSEWSRVTTQLLGVLQHHHSSSGDPSCKPPIDQRVGIQYFQWRINGLWEPPTKQFYSKCQSSSDLPSSQSMRSIGPHPDSHPECQNSGDSAVSLVRGVKKPTSASGLPESSRNDRQPDPADHRSSELPCASRLREHSHESHNRSYVGPAVFIGSSLRPFLGLSRTFVAW